MKVTKSHLLSFFLIGILAVSLRFYDLTGESLWADEATSVTISWGTMSDLLRFSLEVDKVPPGYNLLLHYWMMTFGVSELAIRSLSATAGVLAVLMIVALTRYLFGMGIAFFTGILVSLSEFYIYYSQEVRTYSVYLLLSVLSFYCFARLLYEAKLHRRIAIVYILTTAGMVYFHYYGLFLIFSQAVILLTHLQRRSWKNVFVILGLQAGAFALFIPWLYVFIRQVRDVINRTVIKDIPEKRTIWSMMETYAADNPYAIVISMVLVAAGFWILVKKGKSRYAIFLACWGIVTYVLASLISEWVTPVYVQRYLIGASPPFYIFIGISIQSFIDYFKTLSLKKSTWLSGGIGVILLISGWLYLQGHYYKPVIKDRWRDMVQYIESQTSSSKEKLMVIANPGWGFRPLSYYVALRNLNWELTGIDLLNTGDQMTGEVNLFYGPVAWHKKVVKMNDDPFWKRYFYREDLWVIILNPENFQRKRTYGLPWIQKMGQYAIRECRDFHGVGHRTIVQGPYRGVRLCHLVRE